MIRWITEQLGTGPFEQVESAADLAVVDVRNLLDREGNSSEAIRIKMDEALKQLEQNHRVVICCDYGMSRSNSVAAGVLSLQEGIAFSDAVRRVMDATGEKEIRIDVLSVVRRSLEEFQEAEKSRGDKRRILVTGGSGFIGSTLIPLLEDKYEIVAPRRDELDVQFDTVLLDLKVKESGVDTLVHLANPRIYTNTSAMGAAIVLLKNALDVCVENGLRLVYLSSWEVYSGYRSQGLLADETVAMKPGGTYGQVKVLCENLISHFHDYYGLSYTLLRSSPVYGPGSDKPKFIRNFMNKALQGQEIVAHEYLNGHPKLDLLHIDDLCSALKKALDRQVEGDFNVGSGVGISTTEIAEMLIQRLNSSSEIRHNRLEQYASNIVMDRTRAKQRLDWEPEVRLEDGLSALIESYVSSAKGAESGQE